ncbi:MAG: nucleotide exchange factor GrpE [Solirubrobacteraceae bacterium]
MNPDPTNAPPQAPEAELPQAPPGAPEGHDAAVPDPAPEGHHAAVSEPAPEADEVIETDERAEPAEAFALAGEELKALTSKAAKADEYLQLAQRTQADFENYRRRAARESALAQERGAAKLAQALLPAVDNLERALAHAPASDPADDGGFIAGLKHVHSDVVAALQKAGIERYSPEGEPFDPTLHEAVAQQPVEGYEPGTIVEVFQRGYRMGDSVVRPARVVVAG